jgi:hypothetical protein
VSRSMSSFSSSLPPLPTIIIVVLLLLLLLLLLVVKEELDRVHVRQCGGEVQPQQVPSISSGAWTNNETTRPETSAGPAPRASEGTRPRCPARGSLRGRALTMARSASLQTR